MHQKLLKKRREKDYLKKVEDSPKENRVYVDESGIKKALLREFSRASRGVKIEDVRRGRNYQKVNVVAGQFEKSNGELCCVAPFCYTENTISTLFEAWFKTKLCKAIAKGSTLIMDNASFHRKKKLKDLARRHGMRLLFLPAYSPNINPIEKT